MCMFYCQIVELKSKGSTELQTGCCCYRQLCGCWYFLSGLMVCMEMATRHAPHRLSVTATQDKRQCVLRWPQ